MMNRASVKVLKTIDPPLRWVPVLGMATEDFLKKAVGPNGPTFEELTVGESSVLIESQRVLGRCLPPTSPPDQETGLVVGFVQSGKTMSFETVISLARDNGYGLIIVLAGTKTNLREQSEDRLSKDLGIDEGDNWHHFSNPGKSDASKIFDRLESWKRNPSKKRGVLITLLKRQNYLRTLGQIMDPARLRDIPVLFIDDESDQASLNTQAARIRTRRAPANAKSPVYDSICALRARLPHHTLLQYTATPQANLLLAQADLLNPSFAELVTPGGDYAGGKEFFKERPHLIVEIPAAQVPSPGNVVRTAPKSLVSALRYFLLAAGEHSLTKKKGDRNRSMMVHPSMQTSSHKTYKDWIDKSFKAIRNLIQSEKNPGLVRKQFEPEYKSLKETFPQLSSLELLIEAISDSVLDELNIVEVNRTPDAEKKIKWKSLPYWILVGGEKLGRGYTVEGLTTTYMPRPLGTSPNADTLQQRARFFGYKSAYLGLCRVFLQRDVGEAFSDYVDHEQSMRKALAKNRGKPLSSWRRDFILDASLRATRANVIGRGARRVLVRSWIAPDVMQRDETSAQANRKLLDRIVKTWGREFGPARNASQLEAFRRGKASANEVIEAVPLSRVLGDFLLKVEIKDPLDAESHSAILVGLAELLDEDPGLLVDVFLMNGLVAQFRSRVDGRGVSASHPFAPIGQYFSQSADSLNDKSFHTPGRISLQLRRLNLGTVARDRTSIDVKDVTWFALHVPQNLVKHTHVEER